MSNNNIYDLIDSSNGNVRPMAFGTLEHSFDQSLCTTDTIKCVKVIANDHTIILRYSYEPETEHLNHIAEKYEKWISENYKRVEY